MGHQCANGDRVVAEMAARQHGVVRVGQLREAEIGPDHPSLSREGFGLTDDETTCREGIAVTVPARTLRDLERTAPTSLVRRATRQAEYLGLDLGGVETDGTRRDLERAFLLLCRRHRLPVPEVNVTIGRYTVDFLWGRGRLIVETDGYAAHRGRQAFEDDRALGR